MIAPTALIAHAIPRLLEGNGLRPRTPVGDEILFEGDLHGDPIWVMLTPAPHDSVGARRAMESLASRFKPGTPPTRGLALLVLLHGAGAQADLAALDKTTPREGTEPILRAVEIDLSDGTMRGDVDAIRPLRAVAKTIEKAARASLAGEEPPDLRAVVAEQTNLALAYRARRPWATWAMTAAIVALFLAQRWVPALKNAHLDEFRTPVSRPDLVVLSPLLMPPASPDQPMVILMIALTVISLLSLGSMIERLYGWAAYAAVWFLPAMGATWIAFREDWGATPGPTSAVFALMGATLAMGIVRRALPWTFRRSLLIGSAPILIVNILILVFTAREAARETLAAIALGGLLAAVLPFRPPLSARGGPLLVRLALWASAAACLYGLGLAAYRIAPKKAEAPTAQEYRSPEGWSATAPAGYRPEPPVSGGTTFKGLVSITIEVREEDLVGETPKEEMDRLHRQHTDHPEDRVSVFEAVTLPSGLWWRMRVSDPGGEADIYIGAVGDRSVKIAAQGEIGQVRTDEAQIRSVVASFRLGR